MRLHRIASPQKFDRKKFRIRKLCDLRFSGEARQHKVHACGRYIRAPCIQNPTPDAVWCAGRCYNPVRWSLWTEPSAGVCAVLSRKRRIFFLGARLRRLYRFFGRISGVALSTNVTGIVRAVAVDAYYGCYHYKRLYTSHTRYHGAVSTNIRRL